MADRADEEPEEGFTIRDRRRFTGDSGSAPTPSSTSAASPTASTTHSDSAAEPSVPSPASSLLMTEEMSPAESELDEEMGDLMGEEDESALPDVYSVLFLFLGELRNLAWLRMGLVANPATGQIERDMAQARVAIDTVDFLAKQLDGVVAPEERLPLKSLVSDLQINFVEQSKRGA